MQLDCGSKHQRHHILWSWRCDAEQWHSTVHYIRPRSKDAKMPVNFNGEGASVLNDIWFKECASIYCHWRSKVIQALPWTIIRNLTHHCTTLIPNPSQGKVNESIFLSVFSASFSDSTYFCLKKQTNKHSINHASLHLLHDLLALLANSLWETSG